MNTRNVKHPSLLGFFLRKSICLIAVALCFLFAASSTLVLAQPQKRDTSEDVSIQPASTVTVPAVIISTHSPGQKPALTATVSYDSNISKDKPIRFTFNVAGNKREDMLFYLFSFDVWSNDAGWVPIKDISKNNPRITKNYFEEYINAAGKYRIKFEINEFYLDDEGYRYLYYTTVDETESYRGGYVRFEAQFEVKETGDYKSIDTIVNDVVQQCQTECAEKGDVSDYAKALWLNDWVVKNTAYDNSLTFCGAEGVFSRGLATCEGYHQAYTMLLNKSGIATRRVDSAGDNHVWTGVRLDGKWYNVDTTWNDTQQSAFTPVDVSRLYFAVPNSVIKKVHPNWDEKYFVKLGERAAFDADSYEDNFYIRSGKISTYTAPYLNSSNAIYGVKSHISAKQTSFDLPVEKGSWPDNYKNTIYPLVAYQLGKENWGATVQSLSATYDNSNKLHFNVDYKDSSQIPTVSISFDANGGLIAPNKISGPAGSKITASWPSLNITRSGYNFAGWYTEKADGKGTKVTAYPNEFPDSNVTYYAHWTKQSSGSSSSSGNQGNQSGSSSTGGSNSSLSGSATEQGQVMYRLYNKNSGEHLFTSDLNEKNTLSKIGWKYEDIAWTSPKTSNTPVYRLYNPNSGDHHYTTDKNEYNTLGKIGWKQEDICWYSDEKNRMPIYRLFNPNVTIGTHHYTKDKNEYDTLSKIGWKPEKVGWYGM